MRLNYHNYTNMQCSFVFGVKPWGTLINKASGPINFYSTLVLDLLNLVKGNLTIYLRNLPGCRNDKSDSTEC